MISRASPRQILALASCRACQPFGGHAGVFPRKLHPRKLWPGRLVAALIRKVPCPSRSRARRDGRCRRASRQSIGAARRAEPGRSGGARGRWRVECRTSCGAGFAGRGQGFAVVGDGRPDLAVTRPARRSARLAGFALAGDGDADDLAVKDHVGADKSLAVEHRCAGDGA